MSPCQGLIMKDPACKVMLHSSHFTQVYTPSRCNFDLTPEFFCSGLRIPLYSGAGLLEGERAKVLLECWPQLRRVRAQGPNAVHEQSAGLLVSGG